MKILFAIKTIDNAVGGAERVIVDIASALAERGHNVALFTFDTPGGTPVYKLHPRVRRINLAIGDTGKKTTSFEIFTRILALRSTVRRFGPDIAVPFMHSTFVPMSFALAGSGIPVIASEHIVPQHYRNRLVEFFLLSCSVFFVKKITVISEAVKNLYPFFLRGKMIAMPNPVQKSAQSANPADETAPNIILNVGRLDAQKNQKLLIESFAALAPRFPGWQVHIIGEGRLRPALERQIARLGLQDRVFLKGTTSQIGDAYASARIFALPSSYESFGLATAEAMAHSLPAIGFADCPGTNELITDRENGLLAEGLDSVPAFTAALEYLMNNPAERGRLGSNARQSIESFDTQKIADLWEKLLFQTAG